MNIVLQFFLFFFFLSSFLMPHVLYAADSDIVITEISAYESSDHEWIEIYNKGSSAVDLTGWKFFEGDTNHGLAAFRGGLIIQPQVYAVIADGAVNTAADYPQYQGILIDSSWTTLNEGGEIIGLKNASGATIEQFTYISASDHSLERVDPTLANYTASNWKEHPTGNTIGMAFAQENIQQPQPLQSQQPSQPQQSSVKPSKGSVVINELVSDPSDEEKEWIELYNVTSQAIDLSGWSITNGSGKTILLAGILQGSGSQKYLAIETSGGMQKNLGDKISLLDSQKDVIDSVSYGSWDDGILGDNALRAVNPYSLARKTDGYNTHMNSNDFIITTTPTRGAANVITREPNTQSEQPASKEVQSRQELSVIISELLPNPSSHDPKDEFIELYNNSATDINLVGWRLVDEDEREFIFSKNTLGKIILKSKEYGVIGRDSSGIALNNIGGETLKLYEPGSQKAHFSVRYSDNAKNNLSYSRDVQGRYVWTLRATPGSTNAIVTPNQPPSLSIEWPKNIIEGEKAVFDATDTFDPDNDPFRVVWDFGDGTQAEGLYVSHVFLQSGLVTVIAKALDEEHEEMIQKRLSITASKNITALKQEQPQQLIQEDGVYPIVLNELMPNPKGSDSSEYIELKNIGMVSADISGWMLLSEQSTKRYVFVPGTKINAQALLVVSKKELPFSQSNEYDRIVLLSPSEKEIDTIDFDDAPSGMSYARTTKGDWLWIKHATPGVENNVDGIYDERNDEWDNEDDISGQKKVPSKITDTKKQTQPGIECTIAAVPGILGKNTAYCAHPFVRIRFGFQNIQKLQEGDRIRGNGKVSHSNGQTLITLKNAADISIIRHGEKALASELEINDITDGNLGSLARVGGSIVRMQWPSVWIGSAEHELRAYVYKTTLIKKPEAIVGDTIDITGILDKTASGYRILPRSSEDIRITPAQRKSELFGIVPEKSEKQEKKGNYILATLAALAIVSGGLIVQYFGKKG
ncbi:MAG: lamin tail domain-containing protein [Patescibacteria group bacterium]